MAIYNILIRVWSVWNLRIVVLSSLCLQILLIFLSPLRKRTRRIWLNPIIWLCYLMADWIATYSIGVIVNHITGRGSCKNGGECVDRDLAAFWVPFLLLHLGGPDTITAFSLEDSALWKRHFLNLIVEVVVVLYVLFLAIPSNALWLPLLLVFVTGTIKYAERTHALYLACLGNIKAWKPHRSNMSIVEDRKKEMVIVQDGYGQYKVFRRLISGGVMFTLDDFERSRIFFRGLEPNYGFNVMAIELSFIYDELFTKMATVHRGGKFGYFSRLICNVLIVVAFVISSTTKKLKASHNIDIALSYILLIGAIFLDFIAVIKLVFSDWMIASLKDHPKASEVIYSIYKRMNCYNFRWSESISQHNFISYLMIKNRPQRPRYERWFDATIEYFGLMTSFKEFRYKSDRDVPEGLKEFIYKWLKEKYYTGGMEEREAIISSRGKRTLDSYDVRSEVVNWCVEIDYERSLFLWHIASDLLYFTLSSQEEAEGNINHREICKILSDYMFYLYIMRPSLISTHQDDHFQTRFDETCRDASKVLEREQLSEQRDVCVKMPSFFGCGDFVEREVGTPENVLTDACSLADHLKRITEDKKKMWEIMSKVWLEMLCYGVYHSKGEAHAQHLTRGGELITFVWLLMAHFGLNDCYATIYNLDAISVVN